MPNHNPDIDRVIDLVHQDAKRMAENAGYSGAMNDGGASVLENQVRFYLMGRSGEMPDEWKQYANKLDPEYAEWQRLQKKFGAR